MIPEYPAHIRGETRLWKRAIRSLLQKVSSDTNFKETTKRTPKDNASILLYHKVTQSIYNNSTRLSDKNRAFYSSAL